MPVKCLLGQSLRAYIGIVTQLWYMISDEEMLMWVFAFSHHQVIFGNLKCTNEV